MTIANQIKSILFELSVQFSSASFPIFVIISQLFFLYWTVFNDRKKNHYASNDDRKFFSVDACALFEQLCTLRMTAFDDRIKLKFINISLFIYFFAIQTLISMLYNS